MPCFPSAIDADLGAVFLPEPMLWASYTDTLRQLKYLSSVSRGTIPCNPIIKVLDQNFIVGLVTETDQFVPIIPTPHQENPTGWDANLDPDGLLTRETTGSGNYLALDRLFATDKSSDQERELVVRKIKLESNFFNIFRNTLRMVLRDYETRPQRRDLRDTINTPALPYLAKLERVIEALKVIISPHVDFVDYRIDTATAAQDLILCLGLSSDRCQKVQNCIFSRERDRCLLQLPKHNLVTAADNTVGYYDKLADQLIRYNKIRAFIFAPQSFLSFHPLTYNITKQEIVLLEGTLYGDYFENLVPQPYNPYIRTKAVFDLAEPADSIPYTPFTKLDIEGRPEVSNSCALDNKVAAKLTLGKWRKKGLGQSYKLIEFEDTTICSFQIILELLRGLPKPPITNPAGLLTLLVDKYTSILNGEFREVVLEILKKQGKLEQVRQIRAQTPLEDIFTESNYYLTPLDFMILATDLKLPLVLICRTHIPTIFSDSVAFFRNSKATTVFIVLSGAWNLRKSAVPPVYGIVTTTGYAEIPVSKLSDASDVYEDLTKLKITTIDEFVKRYDIAKKLESKKRVKVKVVESSKPKARKLQGKVTLNKK